ncbi:hypothetical protein QL285_016241 [Trifolium repens]|nr:hypothetical protein QL285_016241 [Trifolium repens]
MVGRHACLHRSQEGGGWLHISKRTNPRVRPHDYVTYVTNFPSMTKRKQRDNALDIPPCIAWIMPNVGIQETTSRKMFSFKNRNNERGRVSDELPSFFA